MKTLFFAFAFLYSTLCAEIKPVHTMQEVLQQFEGNDCTTLGLFDVNLVLIQPTEPAFQMPNMKRYSPVCKRILQTVPKEKQDLFLTLMYLCYDSLLVDSDTPAVIQELASRGIPRMALTANLTGPFAGIGCVADYAVEQLRAFEIDFSCGSPCNGTLAFCELPSYRGDHPLYTEGMLFSNGSLCTKGEVLVAFLKKTGIHPKRVIFIDDKEDNLKNVETYLQKYDASIVFTGLHFLGALDYPSESISEEEFTRRWQELADRANALN